MLEPTTSRFRSVPLLLAGTHGELERERSEALPLSQHPVRPDVPADSEPVVLRITEAT